MSEVWVRDTLRPLRIAFLVTAGDWDGVARAMQYNTALWGGMHNPIVELHDPVSDEDRELIGLFDPDWFVFVGRTSTHGVEDLLSTNGTPEESLFDAVTTYAHKGCDMRLLMRYMRDSGHKFFRVHDPLHGVTAVPRLIQPGPAALFKLSFQGSYPAFPRGPSFEDAYSQAFYPPGMGDPDPFFATAADEGAITYIKATSALLRHTEPPKGRNFVLIADPSAPEDALCYWNARAGGALVTMLPIAFDQRTLHDMDDLGRSEPMPQTEATIVYAPSMLSRAEHPAVQEALNSLGGGRPYEIAEEAIPRYGIHRFEVETSAKEGRLVGPHIVRFEPNSPPFARTVRAMLHESSGPHWANDVVLDYRGSDDYRIAEVLPPGFDVVQMIRFEHIGHRGSLRFSRHGLTALVSAAETIHEWHLPMGSSVVAPWLEQHGIPVVRRDGWPAKAEAHIVEKLIDMAGSLDRCANLLSRDCVRDLFKRLEGTESTSEAIDEQSPPDRDAASWAEGKDRTLARIEGDFRKALNNNEEQARELIERLVKIRALIPGLRFQCAECRMSSWLPFGGFGQEFKCPRCLAPNWLPVLRDQQYQYRYRSHGLLAIPKSSQGGIAVLLALAFWQRFKRNLMDRMSALLTVDVKDDEFGETDLDLTVLLSEPPPFALSTVFCEVKTGHEFDAKDTDRLKWAANRVPNSAVAFCTLNAELSDREKTLLSGLVPWSQGKEDHVLHPVVILTASELTSYLLPPWCWPRETMDDCTQVFGGLPSMRSVHDLSEVTLWRHLGVEPLFRPVRQ